MNPIYVTPLPSLSDPLGFAGMFAGIAGGAILCAGGANFSDVPMAQGGKRVWHDRVFALPAGSDQWREVGRLPKPRAYGVSGSWRDTFVFVGGNDGIRASAEGWLVRWDGKALAFEALPPLPVPSTGCCGTVIGDDLIVAGGQSELDGPAALARCFACDLSSPNRPWRELPWPDGAAGRILAVAGASGGNFYLISGAALAPDAANKPARTYLRDCWRYHAPTGWTRLADLPRPAAAAPSPALAVNRGELFVTGGIWEEYLAQAAAAPSYPGFTREVLVYKETKDVWETLLSVEAAAEFPGRIVAPVVPWQGGWAVISGEVRPGFRTATVERW